VDGGIHNQQKDYDAERDNTLKKTGLRVVRFTNEEVLSNLPGMLSKIRGLLEI